jgi:tellurite resistance protein TehA-like permease
MNILLKNIFAVMAIGCGAAGVGSLTLLLLGAEQYFTDLLILSFCFTVITVVCIVIFIGGQSKAPLKSFSHTLVSISVKLLSEMILALFLFVIAKKNSNGVVLIFFALYLAFTIFLISTILKTLKEKSL